MIIIESFLAGLGMVFTLENMLAIIFGVALGMPLGAIPGITGTMAVAFVLPLTFYMSPIMAIAVLMAISKSAIYGGSISAILINIPGAPGNAPTALDGYELAKQGKSGKALKLALYASVIGDTSSDLVLLFVAAPIAFVALKFGPPEYTMVVLFSLGIIGLLTTESAIKGMIAAGIGLLLSTVGLDPALSSRRFAFGLVDLDAGIGLLPLLVGLLAVAEVFMQLEGKLQVATKSNLSRAICKEDSRLSLAELRSSGKAILRGTAIGTALGSLPGIGAAVAAFTSYAAAKRASKHPERFGRGSLEGIAAAEAANNATCGSNLIPLVTLGIPGNATAAVVLGAFMIHGLTPSPFLMRDNAPMLYALFVALLISNVFVFAIAHIYLKFAPHVARISKPILVSVILMFCVAGSYAFNNSMFDVAVMLVFGIVGYIMKRYGFSLPTVLIAFILGGMFESKLRQSLSMSGGDFSIFFTRPISLVFFILTVLFAISLIFRQRKGRNIKCR
jgi:putative tricarboxylic transport membrane protein